VPNGTPAARAVASTLRDHVGLPVVQQLGLPAAGVHSIAGAFADASKPGLVLSVSQARMSPNRFGSPGRNERFVGDWPREVDPPTQVKMATWPHGGELDWWVKERRGMVRPRARQGRAGSGGSKLVIFVAPAAHSLSKNAICGTTLTPRR